jgi:hypothetical protein
MRGKTDPPRWTVVQVPVEEAEALAREFAAQPRTVWGIFGKPIDESAIAWHVGNPLKEN